MKGNKPIRCFPANTVENGRIIKDLPLVPYGDRLIPLFTVINPEKCDTCESKLKRNTTYIRIIVSSYDILAIPVTYWVCSNKKCGKSHPDRIIGVTGGNNYSDEYMEKMKYTRHKGKCSLHNTNSVGEIFTKDTGHMGRSPCATTIWLYEQEQGSLSLTQLRETNVVFGGKLHVDGLYIKTGWKKHLEAILNRHISRKEWKRLRYKVLYVVATEDKVILDLQITNKEPPFIELIPLFLRLKIRFGAENVKTIVSDEDWAIINAAMHVFPDASLSFCVFHQLQKIDEIFFDIYKNKEQIPYDDRKFYELFKMVILSKSAIESSAYMSKINELMSKEEISIVVKKAYKYVLGKYYSNRSLFEKNITPETNNIMEQIFSTTKDFVIQCRSFKIVSGLKNWAANLFHIKNSSQFKTGINRGRSPLDINASKRGLCA